jgi:hypothetical protein
MLAAGSAAFADGLVSGRAEVWGSGKAEGLGGWGLDAAGVPAGIMLGASKLPIGGGPKLGTFVTCVGDPA